MSTLDLLVPPNPRDNWVRSPLWNFSTDLCQTEPGQPSAQPCRRTDARRSGWLWAGAALSAAGWTAPSSPAWSGLRPPLPPCSPPGRRDAVKCLVWAVTIQLVKWFCPAYLWGVLDQLHSAILQVDEADSHPPQQLQVFRVVCHEVLSPEGRAAHARLPEKRRNRKRRMLKIAVRSGAILQLRRLLTAENMQSIPVRSRARAAPVHSTTDRFS